MRVAAGLWLENIRFFLGAIYVAMIDNLEAWLVAAVGRVALNMLRSRKTRREDPLDAHLPESDRRPRRRHRP